MGDETKLVKTVDVGVIEFAPDAKAVDTDATGYVRARLAKLGVVDLDNDIIEPGALKETRLRVSAWNHESWPRWSGGGELPIGKGRAFEDDGYLWAEMNLLVGEGMEGTDEARKTYAVIKGLGGLGEWSFSLDDIKAQWDEEDGKRTSRRIKSFDMFEVSPVFRGASIGSRTMRVKGAGHGEALDRIVAEVMQLPEELRSYVRAKLDGDEVPADEAKDATTELRNLLAERDNAELRAIAEAVA